MKSEQKIVELRKYLLSCIDAQTDNVVNLEERDRMCIRQLRFAVSIIDEILSN